MSDILSYLAEPETVVVFDIDGVLAPYEFGELSHAACLDGDWKTYVLEEPPMPISVLSLRSSASSRRRGAHASLPARLQKTLRRKGSAISSLRTTGFLPTT